MTPKIEALPAIKAAEKVLAIIIDLEPDEIDLALSALSKASATWGLLWGLENIRRSEKDLEFYMLKRDVLKLFKQIQEDTRYPVAVVAIAGHRAKEARDRVDSS